MAEPVKKPRAKKKIPRAKTAAAGLTLPAVAAQAAPSAPVIEEALKSTPVQEVIVPNPTADGRKFAPDGIKPVAPPQGGVGETAIEERTTDPMKTATAMNLAPVASSVEATEELIAPHEWDALLYSFENDAPATSTSTNASAAQADDDLWERLSSTRWIKTSSRRDVGNNSTVSATPIPQE